MNRRTLITGIAGFAGSHLAEHLLESGDHVEGTHLEGEPLENIRHLTGKVNLHPCDLRSPEELKQAVRNARPDVIYHLAALSSVAHAEQHPRPVLETNFGGTRFLLQAMQQAAPRSRLVYVSSSEVYGRVKPEHNPVQESRPEAPVHIYGFTKLLAEKLVTHYTRLHGIQGIILRPFNHIGPRQSDQFVCSAFARQVARIEKKEQKPVISVGTLKAARDFTDVRDMVKAYRLAAEHCRVGGTYNIASGTGVAIREILRLVLSFSEEQIRIKKKPSLVRKVEIPLITGNADRFRKTAPWQPAYKLEETLWETFRYWMEH